MALSDQARTLQAAPQRRAGVTAATGKAGERRADDRNRCGPLPLVNHLEMHVDQLERALKP